MPVQLALDILENLLETPETPTHEAPEAKRRPKMPPEHEFYLCPFCGARSGRVVPQRVGLAYVCRNCQAKGPVADSPGEAVKLWNKREVYTIEDCTASVRFEKDRCPFCSEHDGHVVRGQDGRFTWFCRKCCACGPEADTAEGARRLFNTRTYYDLMNRAAELPVEGRYTTWSEWDPVAKKKVRKRAFVEWSEWDEVAGKRVFDLETGQYALWTKSELWFMKMQVDEGDAAA